MHGYDNLTYELTTGSYRSSTTRHYRDEQNRAVEVIRTAKGHHGLIVTIRDEFGGGWRTPWHMRSFTLVKTDDGWKATESGWSRHLGITDGEDVWVHRQSEIVRTKAEAEGVALVAARRNAPLGIEV